VFTGVPTDEPDPRLEPVDPFRARHRDPGFSSRLSSEISRRPARFVTACLATVLGPAVVANAGSMKPATATGGGTTEVVVSPEAPRAAPAPGDSFAWGAVARVAAGTCPGLPAAVLVAIGRVESSLGLDAVESPAGALGPMQFLPATWAAYGADGDGDGRADVTDAADAIHGAARLLCANGGADAGRLRSALWQYNHSDDYVERVLLLAGSPGGPGA